MSASMRVTSSRHIASSSFALFIISPSDRRTLCNPSAYITQPPAHSLIHAPRVFVYRRPCTHAHTLWVGRNRCGRTGRWGRHQHVAFGVVGPLPSTLPPLFPPPSHPFPSTLPPPTPEIQTRVGSAPGRNPLEGCWATWISSWAFLCESGPCLTIRTQ